MKKRQIQAILSLLFGIMLAVSSFVARADDDDDGPAINQVKGDLSVMVLGSGGPMAEVASGRASAGYLIFTDGKPRVLMDLGGGTFQRVAQSGANIGAVDIVLLSHMHIDHTADLPAVIKAIYFHSRFLGVSRTNPIRVWGPEGKATPSFPSVSQYINTLFQPGGTYAYLPSFVEHGLFSTFDVEPHDLSADFNNGSVQTILDEDGLVIKEIAVDHFEAPAIAYRIEYKGKSIVYSGDTHSTTDNMVTLGQGADLMIYDTSILDNAPPPQSPFAHRHTTPTRMGEVATMANPKTLLLSHLTPISSPNTSAIKQIIRDQGYMGKIRVASDLKVINVGYDDDQQ